jgi:hypothetical protein
MTRPFKKQAVRSWTPGRKTLTGVGGGQLQFSTWTKGETTLNSMLMTGPPSPLALLLQAERDARGVVRQPSRDRPTLTHTNSDVDASDPGEEEKEKKRAKPRKSKLKQEIVLDLDDMLAEV